MSASTTQAGAFLLPDPSIAGPLEGKKLSEFLQQWISSVSGMQPSAVRPAFQPEPPNVPPVGTAWCAFQLGERVSDEFPFVTHLPGAGDQGGDVDQMQRHEQFPMLVSFYDLGQSGQADFFAAQFRDGALIEANRYYLTAAGFALVRAGPATPAPVLVAQRWQYRVDVETVMRRQITRNYPVRSLVSATGDVYTDVGLPPQPIT